MATRRNPPAVTPLRDEPSDPPPVNNELEQLLLGALFVDNKRFADVGNLKPEHFAFAQNSKLFGLMCALNNQHLPVNPKSLGYLLNGETPYAMQVAEAAVTATPIAVQHYAEQLIALHAIRQVMALACDTPRIFTETKEEHSYVPRLEAVFSEFDSLRKAWREDAPTEIEPMLSLSEWRQRAVPDPDFLLGELISTTSRLMLVGRTGLGKTNLLMAMGMAISLGEDFLHWKGCGQPRKVLFVDAEMSDRQFKRRICDAADRCSRISDTFFPLSHVDVSIPLFLDTSKAQQVIEHQIERLGGVDLIIFDNITFLFTRDDSFGADSWADGHQWRSDLTRRGIGQIWAHHTGHDESHAYGSKTREWALDTVIMMEKTEDESLVSFRLNFPKKRECGPENYRDFDTATITLEDDRWSSERGGDHKRTSRVSPKGQAFLDALVNAIAKGGIPRPQSGNRPSITQGAWQGECLVRGLLEEDKPDSARKLMSRHRLELVAAHQIVCNSEWVWVL